MLKYILAPLAVPMYLISRITSYIGRETGLYAYYDLYTFKRRYLNKVIPLSGYQFHRWQLLNQHTHKQYRAIWLICLRYMRTDYKVLCQYHMSVMLCNSGYNSDETSDLLTPGNANTFDYDKHSV